MQAFNASITTQFSWCLVIIFTWGVSVVVSLAYLYIAINFFLGRDVTSYGSTRVSTVFTMIKTRSSVCCIIVLDTFKINIAMSTESLNVH